MKSFFLTAGYIVASLLPAVCDVRAQLPTNLSPNSRTSSPALAVNPRDTETGSISGRVVTNSGHPIGGATVYLRQIGAQSMHTTVTDERGRFLVTPLSIGSYRVTASAPGYVTPVQEDSAFDPQTYSVGSSVDIVLSKGGVITGMVLNPQGKAVVGVSVRAERVSNADQQRVAATSFSVEGLTDDRGIYRIYGLQAGTYIVGTGGGSQKYLPANYYKYDVRTYYPSDTRDSAAKVSVQLGAEVGGVDIKYRAERGRIVSGHLIGLPTQTVFVFLTLASAGSVTPDFVSSLPMSSVKNGFSFYGIPDGEYDLVVRARNGSVFDAFAIRHLKLKAEDFNRLDIPLVKLSSIAGRFLVDSRSNSCHQDKNIATENIVIKAQRISSTQEPSSSNDFLPGVVYGRVNKTEDFFLSGLRAGQFRIGVQLPGDEWYVESILMAGDPKGTNPTRAPLPPLDVGSKGVQIQAAEALTGMTISVKGGAASLSGRATSGRNLNLNSRVRLVPAETNQEDNLVRYFEATVGHDGTFNLRNLPPGRYFIAAEPTGEVLGSGALGLDPKEQAGIRAQIEKAGRLIEFKPCQQVTGYELPLGLTPDSAVGRAPSR